MFHTITKSNGKQVYIESDAPVVHDAVAEINGRRRGHAERVIRLAAAGAPAIYEIPRRAFLESPDQGHFNRHGETRAALRAWLLARVGLTENDVELTPGNSGQFDTRESVVMK